MLRPSKLNTVVNQTSDFPGKSTARFWGCFPAHTSKWKDWKERTPGYFLLNPIVMKMLPHDKLPISK